MVPRTLLLAVLLVAGLSTCAEPPRQPSAPPGVRPLGWVDVRLASGPTLTLGADGPFVIIDSRGRTVRSSGSLPSRGATLSLGAGRVRLDGQGLAAPPVELRPADGTLLSVDGAPYRGLFRVESAQGDALRVVNRLPVDDYLRGVIPKEMPDRFGLEALKAQSVAARSYALAEIGQRGWLHPDQRSQVYGGVDAETLLTGLAVEGTTDEVLTHDGKVLTAFFHSTCGGGTIPAREMFPGSPRGVMDRPIVCHDCRDSSVWSWERRIPGELVRRAAGLSEGPLQSVTVEPAHFPGRPERVTVTAGGRSASLSGNAFRSRVSSGLPMSEQLLSTRWARAPKVEGGVFVVAGHGWGHGVGLCQFGASGYASRGASYRAILARYYVGAELVRLQ